MKKTIIVFIFLTFFTNYVLSQEVDETPQALEDLIEEIASTSDEELDFSTLYDDLNYFLTNPININSATREQYERLQFLNDIQIEGLLEYIRKNGAMLTIYELQLIEGFDKKDVNLLLPFVTIAKKSEFQPLPLHKILAHGQHQVFLKTQFITQEQKGYSSISDSLLELKPNSRYLGNKYKYYAKYKFQYKNRVFWGITMEKDPGEEFFKETQKNGFDFYSAHFQINNLWYFKRIIAGDYVLQFGQGLVAWSGASYGKSSYALNINKKPQGIKKYSSTDENLFMRGLASIIKLENVEITGFISKKNIDANTASFDSIDDEDVRYITSFQNTGYHTTPSEMEDRKAISEFIYGGNITYRHEKFKAGLTYLEYEFGSSLEKTNKPYNKYEFRGKKNFNVGFDYFFKIKHINVFGEAARSESGGMAFLNGMIIPLAPKISMVALHRKYEVDYHAYYGAAFGENSTNANETGLYIGTEFYPYKKWKVVAYFDSYQFPWLRMRANAPTNGVDYMCQVDYNSSSRVGMYVKFKREIKPENLSSDETVINAPVDVDKWSVRYHIAYQVSPTLNLRNRIEIVRYVKGSDKQWGYMAYQDINYKPEKMPLTISFRFAVFDADYNARMYEYENDILYAFSVPGYYYKGYRTYLTLKYAVTKKINIWLRYAQFTYTDREKISSGSLTEIEGNSKSEIKAQIQIKF